MALHIAYLSDTWSTFCRLFNMGVNQLDDGKILQFEGEKITILLKSNCNLI